MKEPYIINTHSHVNMLKELPAGQAIKNCEDENIRIIVPSYDDKSIFEVDELIKKYYNVYGYVGVFPEEVKCFNDKTLSDMENIIKKAKENEVVNTLFGRKRTVKERCLAINSG